jgi:hypothetical protein
MATPAARRSSPGVIEELAAEAIEEFKTRPVLCEPDGTKYPNLVADAAADVTRKRICTLDDLRLALLELIDRSEKVLEDRTWQEWAQAVVAMELERELMTTDEIATEELNRRRIRRNSQHLPVVDRCERMWTHGSD